MSCRPSRGFTLIEALVALLVLSIGFLGVAAMQMKALQSAHMGFQRSLASLIAVDAEERAWAYLAEERACPTATQIRTDQEWEVNWSQPPGTDFWDSSSVSASDCDYDVSLTWSEGRFEDGGEEVGTFGYSFRLPGATP